MIARLDMPPSSPPTACIPALPHPYGTVDSTQAAIEHATPMMRQFLEVKRQYPGVVMLYRMGDFYETFLEDALTVARALEITLTGREAGKLGKVPMAGVPARALDSYLTRLLAQGYKVAICEQVEDPALAKGLVERRVVRVLSSGTLTDSQHLRADEPNYLAAVYLPPKASQWNDPTGCALAYTDLSTGALVCQQGTYDQVLNQLDALRPAELLVQGRAEKTLAGHHHADWVADVPPAIAHQYTCTALPAASFDPAITVPLLCQTFAVTSLEGLNLDDPGLQRVCGAIAHYLRDSFIDSLPVLQPPRLLRPQDSLFLSATARRHLELLTTAKEGRKEGSLYGVLNRTVTAMGARLLRDWISAPLTDVSAIVARQDGVAALVHAPHARVALRQALPAVYDLERLAQKVANATLQPRDGLALGQSLARIPQLAAAVAGLPAEPFAAFAQYPPTLAELANWIVASIHPEAPVSLKEGGVIRDGVDPNIDRLRQRLATQDQWLSQFEAAERQRTDLRTLKVQFTAAVGYYIELGKATAKQAPPEYTRRQTLTNAERFITPELKAFEEEVLEAQANLRRLESERFLAIREALQPHAPLIAQWAKQVAGLDVFLSLATVAVERHYCRPVVDEGDGLKLVQARHPVIEAHVPMGQFVANDCALKAATIHPLSAGDEAQVQIITGPNMAGKSTYMRQVVLCVLMAQMGSFIPAQSARIGVVDAIYTRIGAVDDLAQGQSTFMVEMAETAQILNGATRRSLVVLDEIGRGTSTYDGVAIAWSVVDYLVHRLGCRTLFATHYHELNVLAMVHPQRVENVRACVSETGDEVVFLHRIEAGSAQKSYGIQVARMAGLPAEVLRLADSKLADLQGESEKTLRQRRATLTRTDENDPQLRLF
jgi:DNA mismatch repair protein MutS